MSSFKFKALFIVLTSLLMIYSCSSDDFCLSNQHAVQVSFYNTYKSTANKDADTTLQNTWIGGAGLTTDSLYNNTSITSAFLPLSFNNDPDTTIFVIRVKDKKDTIWFVHRKELDFISGDCGYVFRFELDKVFFSGQLIDSAAIAYPVVKYGEDFENVKIYIY